MMARPSSLRAGLAALDNQIDRLNTLGSDEPPPPFPHSSQIEGELRELRCHCGRDLYRVLYRRSENLFILLHSRRWSFLGRACPSHGAPARLMPAAAWSPEGAEHGGQDTTATRCVAWHAIRLRFRYSGPHR